MALLETAEAHAGSNALPEARASFEQVAAGPAQVPGLRLRALAGLSWTLCRLGEPEEARKRAEEALALPLSSDTEAASTRAMLQGLLGNAQLAAGRHDEALEAYRASLSTKEAVGAPPLDVAFTLNLLSEAAAQLGRFDLALGYQERAVALMRPLLSPKDPDLAATLTSLGVSLFREDRAEEAERALREALDIDPGLRLASQNLIRVLYDLGREPEGHALAEANYRRCSYVVTPPPANARGTLLLLWSLNGNVPYAHLMAGLPMQLVNWHVEFSDASHERALPRYDLVLNLVGDADEGAGALAHAVPFKSRCAVRLLNDPANIQRTHRHEIADRLAGIDGLVIPRVVHMQAAALQPDAQAAMQRHGLTLPVLFRHAGKHGGESVALVETTDALQAATAVVAANQDVYLTEFHPYAGGDGLFRKYRAIFVDRVPLPYHLAISPKWLVHYFSAEMLEAEWKLDEERRYLHDMPAAIGARAMQVLTEIAARMDLDYCGIDFGLLPDGRVLLFECNATMLVHTEKENGPLAHKNPYVARIVAAFQTMLTSALDRQLLSS